MSYLVLARKYRPQNFEEMVGQEHVVQALSNALAKQRLHHAYLFTGTRGVGKTTVSRILAKSLNCQGPDGQGGITAHPCGVCQACRDIDAGRFVDYTELDAASNRGVEEVQSLMEQAVYKPVQGRFKVFMIDEVHMLSNTAFNAMLKTLEEPPEYLKFVLATTDPQKVPVTVLSRCLQFNLRPMAPQTVAEHLQQVLGKEGVPYDRPSLQLLARAARGSMRDALSLTDQAIAFGDGALVEATVRRMLGVVDKRYVLDAIGALAQSNGAAVVALVDALRQEGIAAASLLEDMALALQKMALLQSLPNLAEETLDEPDAARLKDLAAQLPPDETQLLYTLCLKGREELGLAPDEYSGLVMVLLRLLAFKLPPGEIRVQTQPAGGFAPANVEAPAPSAQPAPSAATSVDQAPAALAPREHTHALDHQAHSAVIEAEKKPETAIPAPDARTLPPWEVQPPQMSQPPAVVQQPDAAQSVASAASAPQSVETVVPQSVEAVVPQPSSAVDTPTDVAVPARPDENSQPCAAAPQESAVRLPDAALPLDAWWHALVSDLVERGQLTALVRELAMQSQLVGRDGAQLSLRIANTSLLGDALRKKLETVLAQTGVAFRIVVEQGQAEHSPAQQQQALKEAAQRRAEAIVEEDPRVQWLRENLGGQIVPGSIHPVVTQAASHQ
ncbi:DNA polymerase III subunits gamma and tau [Lampropedia cohaerens]|uniref:DNA polymerase III subunit gamma/tau n=1 Tax=Lampropedia cohaerens TaxID=1610491 RepID=A0A0U1PXZ9_9BURK|nr:DNA polymerase III subunit gamma/tau [Lampropedia cohaerens]KKW67399.1 DNA polymerase III subunits gamma and tau [Lampropedia cohaerens]